VHVDPSGDRRSPGKTRETLADIVVAGEDGDLNLLIGKGSAQGRGAADGSASIPGRLV